MKLIELLETRQLLSGSDDISSAAALDDPSMLHASDAAAFAATASPIAPTTIMGFTVTIVPEVTRAVEGDIVRFAFTILQSDGSAPAQGVLRGHAKEAPLDAGGRAAVALFMTRFEPVISLAFIPDGPDTVEVPVEVDLRALGVKLMRPTGIQLEMLGAPAVAGPPTFVARLTGYGGSPFSYEPYTPAVGPTLKLASASTLLNTRTVVPREPLNQAVIVPIAAVAAATPSRSELFPAGKVRFYMGSKLLGVARIDERGMAGFTPKRLAPGRYKIRAEYAGSKKFLPAAPATARFDVRRAKTQMLLESLPYGRTNVSYVHVSVISKVPGTVNPTGKVTFQDGETVLGTLDLGSSNLQHLRLRTGTYDVRAVYHGDENYKPSRSRVIRIHVEWDDAKRPWPKALPYLD